MNLSDFREDYRRGALDRAALEANPIAQFESWRLAVIVLLSLNLIQFLIGSYFEPRMAGAALSVSPFIILFAVFFWSFLWGIPGAFIGVPVVIAFLTICQEHESTFWIAEFLSGGKKMS